jgi:hypothetical protein
VLKTSSIGLRSVGKDGGQPTWRKVRTDWEVWIKRDLAGEDVVRLILDGTVVRVRLDRSGALSDGAFHGRD